MIRLRPNKILLLLIAILLYGKSPGQQTPIDSLTAYIAQSPDDSNKVKSLLSLSQLYFGVAPTMAIQMANRANRLARKINYYSGAAYALKNEGIAYYYQGDYVEALTAWQKSLAVFDSIHDKVGVANILSNIGAIYYNESSYNEALDYYLRSLKVSEDIGDTLRIVTALTNIGAVYNDKPATHDKALEYSLKALKMSEAIDNRDAIATNAVNIGEVYLYRRNNEKALEYFKKALDAMKGTDGIIYSMVSISKVYANLGNFDRALETLQEALQLADQLNAKPNKAHALIALAEVHQQIGNKTLALRYFKQAVALAQEVSATKDLERAFIGLNTLYAQSNKYDSAYKYQQLLMVLKDTLYNAETDRQLSNQLFNFQIEKKQNEINLLKKDQELKTLDIQKQKVINGLVGAGLFSVVIFLLVVLSQKRKITREKERSEELLLNILPYEIAEELKEKGKSDAKNFDEVTVLFSDFQEFTGLSEKLSANELVQEINYYFKAFDGIVTKYNIEKIKTIGDSYMAAGGLPVPSQDSVKNVLLAALEMQDVVVKRQGLDDEPHSHLFNMRVGVHSGPVVAGIVGVKKFQYDIWGDTVNTASRMESTSEVGKVNISESTYRKVKDCSEFSFEYRGKIEAKGKGMVEMYFVSFSAPRPA